MSRRKEIEQAAMQVGGVHPDWDVLECFRVGFKEGARWADKTMIDKATQWIESYLFDIGFPDDWCRDSATMKSGKQRFLEAMEE